MVPYEFYALHRSGVAQLPVEQWDHYQGLAAAQLAKYKRTYTVTVPPDGPECEDWALDVPAAEALAICAMAEAFASFDAVAGGSGGPVTSAAIGSVSVSYGGTANALDLSPAGQGRELLRCAGLYLDIYRGVG